jgi:hypothetical protein
LAIRRDGSGIDRRDDAASSPRRRHGSIARQKPVHRDQNLRGVIYITQKLDILNPFD